MRLPRLAPMPLMLGLGVLLLTAGGPPAQAAPITYDYTGTVNFLSAGFANPLFSVGSPITGSFTYEATTPAQPGATSTVASYHALTAFSITVGGYGAAYTGAPGPAVNIINGSSDTFIIGKGSPTGLSGPPVNGLPLSSVDWRLVDNTGTAFSTALTLPTSLSLASFTGSVLKVSFFDGSTSAHTLGSLTSLTLAAPGAGPTPSPTPEPTSIVLLGTGLAGLCALKRARHRAAIA